MKSKHRYFDPLLKEEAVYLSNKHNNKSHLARQLNITPSLLHNWRSSYAKIGAGCFCGKGRKRTPNEPHELVEQKQAVRTPKQRYYHPNFKEQAVLLSYQRSTISEIEKELDITPLLLYTWRKTYQRYGPGCFNGKGKPRKDAYQEKVHQMENKCREMELQVEILKKSCHYSAQGRSAVFEFIKKHEQKYTLQKLCSVLEISESTYRKWKKQPVSDTKRRIILLKEKISSVFYHSGRYYGCVKIAQELKNKGTDICRTQVALYMSEMGLRRKAKRKFKITTDSRHNFYTSPNVLNQHFKVDGPSMAWVSDITYIQTTKGFVYLTIIMDLYDRKIIGWSLSSTLTARRTSVAAWEMAELTRDVSSGLIFHSDRGVQYACRAFTSKLDSYKCITRSMSRRENSLDNAPAESFFNTLKRELLYHSKLQSRKDTRKSVIDYIENWYNKKRIHSSLNYLTIEEFNMESKPNYL